MEFLTRLTSLTWNQYETRFETLRRLIPNVLSLNRSQSKRNTSFNRDRNINCLLSSNINFQFRLWFSISTSRWTSLSADSQARLGASEKHSLHIVYIIVVILVVLTRWPSFNVSRDTPFDRPLFKVLLDFVNTFSRSPWRWSISSRFRCIETLIFFFMRSLRCFLMSSAPLFYELDDFEYVPKDTTARHVSFTTAYKIHLVQNFAFISYHIGVLWLNTTSRHYSMTTFDGKYARVLFMIIIRWFSHPWNQQ